MAEHSYRDLIYWRDVFRILGIRSCHPLLERMGVAAEMAAQPEGLLRAANYFWNKDWQGVPRDGVGELLNQVFAIVSKQYGEDAANDLYGWSQRFFVDNDQGNLWFTWYMLLSSVLKFQSESQFPDEIARFGSQLEEEFGDATEESESRALSEIDIAKLSPAEYKMIALEVTRPTDFVTVDLEYLAARALHLNHAYRFWRVLNSSLEPAEFDTWLWIGYESAARMGMPAGDVQLPIFS